MAAERLARHPYWTEAEILKVNPDSPQTHVRRLALESGKSLVMAVPRLREEHPFRLLNPKKMTKDQITKEMNANGFELKRQYDGLPWQHLMFFGKSAK